MHDKISKLISKTIINELDSLSFQALKDRFLDNPQSYNQTIDSRYQVEVEAMWDDRKKLNLRVFVVVTSPRFFSHFFPSSSSFLRANTD